MKRLHKKASLVEKVVGFGILFVFLAFLNVGGIGFLLACNDDGRISARVEKAERVTDSSSSYYLVFTDQGVFRNHDSWWWRKFNSSDIYGQIKEGDRLDIHYYGWRVPFLSWYPNIISVTKSDPQ